MEEDAVLKKIKSQIQGDLEPVHALPPVWKRVLLLFPIWIVLIALVLAVFGLRPDYDVVGPWLLWSLLLVQFLAAYLIIAFGVRSTIPGSAVPVPLLIIFTFIGLATHLILTETVFRLSPTLVESEREFLVSCVCFSITLFLGLIPLALFLLLSSKGLTSHPALLGLVCGLGSGLSGEAVWRMHCPYNSWDHILTAHSGAIVAVAILGCIIRKKAGRR